MCTNISKIVNKRNKNVQLYKSMTLYLLGNNKKKKKLKIKTHTHYTQTYKSNDDNVIREEKENNIQR